MTALDHVNAMFSDPAPGLVFSKHERAAKPRRAHPTPHTWKGSMTGAERAVLDALAPPGDAALADLRALYARSNGVDLFTLTCPDCDDPHPAVQFLPVGEWEEKTAAWKPGGMCASFMEECPLYTCGEWRIIATLASEGMSLVMFFSGEHEGEPQAGRLYCIGLDGYLGFQELLAPDLGTLIGDIRRDPAAFFKRLGFSWVVNGEAGSFGDEIEGYAPDVRAHDAYAPWPPKS